MAVNDRTTYAYEDNSWSLKRMTLRQVVLRNHVLRNLRLNEASSRQTSNVESYIRIDIQHHGLVHEGNED